MRPGDEIEQEIVRKIAILPHYIARSVRHRTGASFDIAPAMEQQGRNVAHFMPQHFADHDDMVATFILVTGAAFEQCCMFVEHGGSHLPGAPADPGKFVLPRPGEAVGQILLTGGKYMDGEMPAGAKCFAREAVFGERPEH